jgi:hypothetical protein
MPVAAGLTYQISFVSTRSTCAMSLCETELASPSIPRNGDFAPRRSGNRAKVHCRGSPANAGADSECSGLVAGHLIGCPQTPHGEFDLSIG